MRKNRFYIETGLAQVDEVQLSDRAAQHAARVLRLKVGDQVTLFNGDGFDYDCELISVHKSTVMVKVLRSEMTENESPLDIVLLQGISNGYRMDYTIQKAVELGVKRIQPIDTARSVVKLNASRVERRVLHWQGVAISASEQSGRVVVPVVEKPMSLANWLAHDDQASVCRLLLNPEGAVRLAGLKNPKLPIQLLVGAEGGLTSAEIELATSRGFESVLLGPRILRTETAALAAVSALLAIWGDF